MSLLMDSLTYAWRGGGKYVFVICAVMSLVQMLSRFAPLIGLIAALFIAAYFCALYFQMVQTTAVGRDEAPEFPEISHLMSDIVFPALQTCLVILVSFAPFLGYLYLADEVDPSISLALQIFGCIYAPMGMLAVVVLGYSLAVSPHIVIPALFRSGWFYWIGILLLIFLTLLQLRFKAVLGDTLIGQGIMILLKTYIFMTNARIFGLVYRERQEELGWL